MKTKDKDSKKNLSIEELKAELTQLREKEFKLRFKHRVTPLSNPLELRAIGRDIARIHTWIRAKELQGEGK
jgi:large subunit ribosomal protein L29